MSESIKLSVWCVIRCYLFITHSQQLVLGYRLPGRRQLSPASTPVNLLPWREQRRRTRKRFWLMLLVASSLLCCVLTAMLHYSIQQNNQQLSLINQQQQALNQELQQRLNTAQRQYQQQQHLQQTSVNRQQRQQVMRRWRLLLEQIANDLPDDAWLTQLSYQQPSVKTTASASFQLRIEGFAANIKALQGSARAFSHLPGFATAHHGNTEREGDNWRFCFLLAETSP